MASLSSIFCVLVLCAVIPISTCSHGHSGKLEKNVAFFIFGDSLFDPGNNNYINTTTAMQANFWPYGETFFKYPTGRFSDGRIIPDFISEFAKLPLIKPFLQPGIRKITDGANFASGGAGALVETRPGLVINLKTQVSYFKKIERRLKQKLVDAEAKNMLSRAVYLINIGTNDYLSPLFTNGSYSPTDYVDMVIGNLTSAIQEIYMSGGRKFGFLGLMPMGCRPSSRILEPEGSCNEELNTLAKLHNKALTELLERLEGQLEGFKYSMFNMFNSSTQRMNHPTRYGFKEGKSACCGTGPFRGVYSCGGQRTVKEYQLCDNPSEYVFFDSNHFTQEAYQQLADLMWSGTPDVVGPYNLKALFE